MPFGAAHDVARVTLLWAPNVPGNVRHFGWLRLALFGVELDGGKAWRSRLPGALGVRFVWEQNAYYASGSVSGRRVRVEESMEKSTNIP